MITINQEGSAQQAWVVFNDQTDIPWLRIFKRGFRHCFIILHDGTNWISLDPLSTYTDVVVYKLPPEFNLPIWLKERGHIVIKSPIRRGSKLAPFMIYNCVEEVKRVLGLHKRWIFTPYQLYRYLENTAWEV